MRGQNLALPKRLISQPTVDRIKWKAPYPSLRHHYGQPTLKRQSRDPKNRSGKSIGRDFIGHRLRRSGEFFHPERQNPRQTGRSGVLVRSAEDYRALYAASRTGNFLDGSYSGTDDFLKLAQLYKDTINIACVPSPFSGLTKWTVADFWGLEDSIRKHQEVMAWYGNEGIPVELNEPHHWGMRDAPMSFDVASAYLSAYNAKRLWVRDYIAQMMFNSPGTSDAMDLAKMLACLALTEPLHDDGSCLWRQT